MSMMIQVTKSGVIGDASKATLETGENLLEAVVERIFVLCSELAEKVDCR